MEEQIAQLIVLLVRHAPGSIVGSYLGTQIKNQFPMTDLKLLGGLRQFIAQHCAEQVVWLGKKGGDDMYAHVSKVREPNRQFEGGKPLLLAPAVLRENYWRIFTSPNSPRSLIVNASSGEIASHALPTAPAGWRIIAKMSVEEHRDIAQQFLAQVELLDRAEFEKALQLQQFWIPWLQLVRHGFSGRYLNQWWAVRTSAVTQLFAEKLRQAEIPSSIAPMTVKALLDSRSYREPQTRPPIPGQFLTARHSLASEARAPDSSFDTAEERATELRRLIREALEGLKEDELRQIRLPIGAIADGLSRRNQ